MDVNHLAAVAVSRLQGELAKEGREPSLAKGVRENSISGKTAALKSPGRTRGINADLTDSFSSFLIMRKARDVL